MKFPIIASTAAMIAAAAGGLIEEHSLDLKTVFSVGGIVLTATWWLSRRFARIEERLHQLEKIEHRIELVEKLITIMATSKKVEDSLKESA